MLFTHSSADEHLGYLHVLTGVNDVATNLGTQVFA